MSNHFMRTSIYKYRIVRGRLSDVRAVVFQEASLVYSYGGFSKLLSAKSRHVTPPLYIHKDTGVDEETWPV